MEKVRFAEHTIVLVSQAVSTPHTVSALVAHGGSSSSSVEHVRPDECGCELVECLLDRFERVPRTPLSASAKLSFAPLAMQRESPRECWHGQVLSNFKELVAILNVVRERAQVFCPHAGRPSCCSTTCLPDTLQKFLIC